MPHPEGYITFEIPAHELYCPVTISGLILITAHVLLMCIIRTVRLLKISCWSPHARRHSTDRPEKRILDDDENVYLAQKEWKTNGKFVIMDKSQAEHDIIHVCRNIFVKLDINFYLYPMKYQCFST